jgi:preprotein translocase subunit YajC
MKHTLLFLSLLVVTTLPAFAQNTFRVGDTVTTPDGRTGKIESFKDRVAKVKLGPSENDFQYLVVEDLKRVAAIPKETFQVGDTVVSPGGGTGRIESINGNSAKVKTGPGKYDFKYDLLENLQSPKTAATEREQEKQRTIFRAEADGFFWAVRMFEQFYNPEFAEVKGGMDAAVIKKATVAFAELDALCSSKYPGITNDPKYLDRLMFRSGDWCGMAAKRNEILKSVTSGTQSAVGSRFIEGWKRSIDQSYQRRGSSSGDLVSDEVQAMLFDREKWKAKDLSNLQRLYAENGGTVPAEIFDAVNPELERLRQKVETDSQATSWTVPPYKDEAVEAFVKRSYASNPKFRGIVIVKSGMDFTTWKLFKNDLGIPTSQIKQGWLLVKIVNQKGLCQARGFAVEKEYIGGGRFSAVQMAAFSEAGIYMRCN